MHCWAHLGDCLLLPLNSFRDSELQSFQRETHLEEYKHYATKSKALIEKTYLCYYFKSGRNTEQVDHKLDFTYITPLLFFPSEDQTALTGKNTYTQEFSEGT